LDINICRNQLPELRSRKPQNIGRRQFHQQLPSLPIKHRKHITVTGTTNRIDRCGIQSFGDVFWQAFFEWGLGMVDTKVPIAGALVQVGLALEDGAGDVELGERGMRWGVLSIGKKEGGLTTLHLWAIRSPTEPKARAPN